MTQVEEIKSKLDIVDLIQEYTPLKQSGINLKGLCPFHNEKTPSFMVSREKQFFKCFGCGEGGDIFTFLQKIENLEFPEALKILAEKAGVKLIKQSYNPVFENLKTRLYDLHESAVEFYQAQLFAPIGATALNYLKKERGLPNNILKDFQIGYAQESWDAMAKFLKTKGFTDSEILQSGLVVEKNNQVKGGLNYYDRFRNRIMFPILDYHGNVVGFTARAMNKEESAKYINTPQTLIYNKSQVLYGLDKAKKAIRERGYVILVEGNMDVIASHKAGVKNIVASSGTSLTVDQLKILKRHTENLALCFDADSAGIKAAERGVDLIWAEGLNAKVIVLPKNFKDPDELVKVNPAIWVAVSQKFINFMDYFLYLNLSQKNLSVVDVKKIIANKILPWINKLTNPIDREHYLKVLASKINVAETTLKEVMQKNFLKTNVNNTQSIDSDRQTIKIDKEKIMTERFLAIILGQSEYLIQAINKLLPEMLYKDYEEFYKELIFCYTKNNSFNIQEFENILKINKKTLLFILESLKLFYETEFSVLAPKEINKEFVDAVNYLKKEKIFHRLKEIEAELRIAERESQRQLADSLMQEFSELSREINS